MHVHMTSTWPAHGNRFIVHKEDQLITTAMIGGYDKTHKTVVSKPMNGLAAVLCYCLHLWHVSLLCFLVECMCMIPDSKGHVWGWLVTQVLYNVCKWMDGRLLAEGECVCVCVCMCVCVCEFVCNPCLATRVYVYYRTIVYVYMFMWKLPLSSALLVIHFCC